MKKFYITALLFLLIFYALWSASFYIFPLHFKGEDYISWHYKFEEIDKSKFHNSIIILGDSATEAGFDPLKLSGESKVYNLALPGSHSFDSYIYLKRLIDSGIRPKKVLIIFSAYNYVLPGNTLIRNHLNFDLYSLSEVSKAIEWQREHDFFYKKFDHYKNLSVYFPFNLFFSEKTNDQKARLSYFEFFLSKIKLSFLDYIHIKRWITGQVTLDRFPRGEIKKHLMAHRGHLDYPDEKIKGLIYPTEKLKGTFAPHPFIEKYLIETLKLLKEEKIPVAMPYSPIPKVYYDLSSKDFLNYYEQYMKRLSRDFEVQVDPEMKWFSQELFGDQIHLNTKGIEIYTKRVEKNHL